MLKDASLLLEHAIDAERRLKQYSQEVIGLLASRGRYDPRLEVITHPSFYANNTKLDGQFPVREKYKLDEVDVVRRFYKQMPSESKAIEIIEEQVKTLGLGEDVTYSIIFEKYISRAGGLGITLEDKLRCTINPIHSVFYLKNMASAHSYVELKPEMQSDGNYVWSARLLDSKDVVLAKLELAKQGYLIIAVQDMKSAEELGKRLMGSENRVMAYRVLSGPDLRGIYNNDSPQDVVPTIMTRLSLTRGHELSDVNTLAQTRLIERAEDINK